MIENSQNSLLCRSKQRACREAVGRKSRQENGISSRPHRQPWPCHHAHTKSSTMPNIVCTEGSGRISILIHVMPQCSAKVALPILQLPPRLNLKWSGYKKTRISSQDLNPVHHEYRKMKTSIYNNCNQREVKTLQVDFPCNKTLNGVLCVIAYCSI